MVEHTFLCSKCNRRVPTDQVRLLGGGKYVCFECAGYSPAAPSGKAVREEERARAPQSAPRVRYQCLKCNYEFYLKEGHTLKCPYCNSDRIEEKRSAAQKLLDMGGSYRDEE